MIVEKGSIKYGDENDRLRLTVCQLTPEAEIDLRGDFYFIAKTDEEISLVCPEEAVPRIR